MKEGRKGRRDRGRKSVNPELYNQLIIQEWKQRNKFQTKINEVYQPQTFTKTTNKKTYFSKKNKSK